ncbi:hypothetical protein ACHAWF_002660 [Thalassiosira exigua]
MNFFKRTPLLLLALIASASADVFAPNEAALATEHVLDEPSVESSNYIDAIPEDMELVEAGVGRDRYHQRCIRNCQRRGGRPTRRPTRQPTRRPTRMPTVPTVIGPTDPDTPRPTPSPTQRQPTLPNGPSRSMDNDEVFDDDSVDDDSVGGSSSRCVGDRRPRTFRGRRRFIVDLVESNARCVDRRDRPYEYGSFRRVRSFEDCAEYCVKDVPRRLLESFRGIDFDCNSSSCRCLYDSGSLSNRMRSGFDRVNRNNRGRGPVEGAERRRGVYCGKLVESEGMSEVTGAEVEFDELADVENVAGAEASMDQSASAKGADDNAAIEDETLAVE